MATNHFNELLLQTLKEIRLRLDRVDGCLKRLEDGLERVDVRSHEQHLDRTERNIRALKWLMSAKVAVIGVLLVSIRAC